MPRVDYRKALRWTPQMRRWVTGAALAAVVVASLVSLGLVVGLTKSEWADWVQAIGSIAAIMSGFSLARWQLRRDRRDRQEREAARLESRALLFQHAKDAGRSILSEHIDGTPAVNEATRRRYFKLQELVAALRRIRIDEAANPVELDALLSMRNALSEVDKVLEAPRDVRMKSIPRLDFSMALDELGGYAWRLRAEASRIRGA